MIDIRQTTMKRLLNYQRVIEKKARDANRLQWTKMTLDNMRFAEAAIQKAGHIGAIVDYSGSLFRIQNRIPPFRLFHDDYHLHNGLVKLMNELGIPINLINVEIPSDIVEN